MNMEEIVTSIADCIYARRCEEHAHVLCDCLKPEKKYMVRQIPPYCGEWCNLINEPTAKLKDDFDWKSLLKA